MNLPTPSDVNSSSVAEKPIDKPAAAATPAKTLKSQLLGGSLTLLAGSGLVGVTNLIYNVATARLLGPTGFAHATAVYTLLMLLSAITLSFQVVCAKYVAKTSSPDDKASVFASLHQRAWLAGIAIGLLLFLGKHLLTRYLNLPDPVLISLLALGIAFYVPLGVRRGYIQGVHAFGPLALNFMLEGVAFHCLNGGRQKMSGDFSTSGLSRLFQPCFVLQDWQSVLRLLGSLLPPWESAIIWSMTRFSVGPQNSHSSKGLNPALIKLYLSWRTVSFMLIAVYLVRVWMVGMRECVHTYLPSIMLCSSLKVCWYLPTSRRCHECGGTCVWGNAQHNQHFPGIWYMD